MLCIFIYFIYLDLYFQNLINTLSVNKVIKLPIYYIHWNLIYLYGLTLWCLIRVTRLLYISICRHHSCLFIVRQFQDNPILLRMVCPDCIIRSKLAVICKAIASIIFVLIYAYKIFLVNTEFLLHKLDWLLSLTIIEYCSETYAIQFDIFKMKMYVKYTIVI